jgi:hypothetical protein
MFLVAVTVWVEDVEVAPQKTKPHVFWYGSSCGDISPHTKRSFVKEEVVR